MAKKKNANKSYFILGKDSTVFWDPSAQLKVVSRDAKHPTLHEGAWTKRIDLAARSGHIIEVDEPEPEAEEVASKAPKIPTSPKKADKVDRDEDEDDLLEEDTEDEAETEDESNEEDTDETDLNAMDDAQLQKFYEDTYDVTAKDKKAFAKMSKEEKIKLLQEEE